MTQKSISTVLSGTLHSSMPLDRAVAFAYDVLAYDPEGVTDAMLARNSNPTVWMLYMCSCGLPTICLRMTLSYAAEKQ